MNGKRQSILVCGGAGYIGSHMVRMLCDEGYRPIVLDNFSTGHAKALQGKAVCDVPVLRADLRDPGAVREVFRQNGHAIDAVMHFCAMNLVGESFKDPITHYANNVGGTLNLLTAMREAGIDRLIFSSTAAVYGQPESGAPLAEDSPQKPINPYGTGKKQVEDMLRDAFAAHGFRSVCLRYFNAAGAQDDGSIGEAHEPESHLIPNMLKAALGTGPALTVFGEDYPTPDGTCLRDYVHVEDLCRAHLLALDHLNAEAGAHVFNLGNGNGFSVKEVLRAGQSVTGKRVPHSIGPRRAGDCARLVADGAKAGSVLGWQPRHTDLGAIVESAWRWHCGQKY